MTEPKKIEAVECRFAIHIPANKERPDLHLVKEFVHYSDQSTEPRLRWIKEFKRPFYTTIPTHRTYKQKKEIESFDKLMKHECTQSELRDKIAETLDMGYSHDHIKKLSNSPYLYGSEISSTAIIKHQYQKKNQNHITNYNVMFLDIETDMVEGHQDPIIITVVYKNDIFIAVTDAFIKGIAHPENLYKERCQQYVKDFVDLTPYNLIYLQATDTVDLIKKTFEWIHTKKPDFLAIWNIQFDWPKMTDTLIKYGVNPEDVFCDPSVPKVARISKWKPGPDKKRKANGQEVPIDIADRWHHVLLTASFMPIDAMCTYRLLRLAKQKEPSYSLDAILNKELGLRKLKFQKADKYIKDQWHIFMQKNYKIEYMVYAMFDSLSMKLLDEKTLDLCFTLPSYAGITDFSRANSKPKMIADALHYYTLEQGYVLNSVGEQLEYKDEPPAESLESSEDEIETIESPENPSIMGLRDWIVTLPAHLVTLGLPLIEEDPTLRTKLRAFVYDSDCVSAYPTATSILNVSKSTTKRELIAIDGIPEEVFRLQNINLCSGHVNALEYGKTMFGLPSLFDLPDLIE